ncbi:MAG TPA: transposase, partial [Micromonosporaceae bacterium]|nr:transposase [Micromonosporaceae bacterium]
YLAYVSRREHALVDVQLFLPEEWARSRARMRAAGVPAAIDEIAGYRIYRPSGPMDVPVR